MHIQTNDDDNDYDEDRDTPINGRAEEQKKDSKPHSKHTACIGRA